MPAPKSRRPAPARGAAAPPIAMRDACFVIMPFGEKTDLKRKVVKFDAIYADLIAPAISAAGLTPVRCDELYEAGLIQRKMLEHIRDARAAVVDISLLNANVFYELGIRHTLRRSLTVLVRRSGTNVPFNISNMNVIEYDESDRARLADAKAQITTFLVNGLSGTKNDSLVHELLDVRVAAPSQPLKRQQIFRYRFADRPVSIELVTGGIQLLKQVDVWVNAENTNMQMARFYDWSISSLIRYWGALRDATGTVERSEHDVIANELAAIMKGRLSVPGGTVIRTGAGELQRSHGVKAIFHAAAVQGQIGLGYTRVANLADCVTTALEKMDDPQPGLPPLTSIAFPLLGAGVDPDGLPEIVTQLFEATVSYLERHPNSTVARVCFLPWTAIELETCISALNSFRELSRDENA
jgi:O-acetyl-ADP-ribose deacetylase (regulator of RNase III)